LTTGAAAALLLGLEVEVSEELLRREILSEGRTETADLRGAMENLSSATGELESGVKMSWVAMGIGNFRARTNRMRERGSMAFVAVT